VLGFRVRIRVYGEGVWLVLWAWLVLGSLVLIDC